MSDDEPAPDTGPAAPVPPPDGSAVDPDTTIELGEILRPHDRDQLVRSALSLGVDLRVVEHGLPVPAPPSSYGPVTAGGGIPGPPSDPDLTVELGEILPTPGAAAPIGPGPVAPLGPTAHHPGSPGSPGGSVDPAGGRSPDHWTSPLPRQRVALQLGRRLAEAGARLNEHNEDVVRGVLDVTEPRRRRWWHRVLRPRPRATVLEDFEFALSDAGDGTTRVDLVRCGPVSRPMVLALLPEG